MIQRKKKGTNNGATRVATSIPPMTLVPMAWRLAAPAPVLTGKGHAAEDEGQRSHHDGPETQTGGFFGRVHRVLAFVTVLLDGKFHDQDGVFRRQAISVTRAT